VTETDSFATAIRRAHPNDYIEWNNKILTDETVEYLADDVVVFTRPRCPVINVKVNKGQRCRMPVGTGFTVCRNHNRRA